jgi:hypothetical protein
MIRSLTITLTAALLPVMAHTALAQQPPRPIETPRAVTLSLTEYNRLLDLASRQPANTLVPPVAAVVASADLRVRVDRDTVRGVFDVKGEALRAGISRVNLLSGATLIDASADGKPLPLLADGSAHTALIPGPGPFSLALEWGTPLVSTPGRASFVLPVPQSGTARARFDLPGDQADVHLSAGLVTSHSVADGRTIVEATLDPGSATEVWWSMRDSAPTAAAREVRTLADVLTLVTLGDSDVRMTSLVDLTVVQGDLRTVAVRLPVGYEVTGISGSSLESSETVGGGLVLTVGGAARSHQFLITLERPHADGSFSFDTGFVSVPDAQRERGEVAIEGVGTLELSADEHDLLRRVDVRELGQALQQLTRLPTLSAFRYQRLPGATPSLTLDVKRFSDAGVLAAVAERAVATTLVTSEGRALTEVVLTVQNRAQPFLKVSLPQGATMVSVNVGGQPAKPALGPDGSRVPLLRPGFRPSGSYEVSFVYLHAGTPFAKKGDIEMMLPKMDMPVGIVEWELFAPEGYSLRTIGGNALDVRTLDASMRLRAHERDSREGGVAGGVVGGSAAAYAGSSVRVSLTSVGLPGQVRGRVADPSGGVLPGVTIELISPTVTMTVVTDSNGAFVLSNVSPGQLTIRATLAGFTTSQGSFAFDQRPRQVDIELNVGTVAETVSVASQTTRVDSKTVAAAPPPSNVVDLQRRAAGVLPVRIDVPRAGTSYMFVKPLVVDQETVVKLRYKRKS